MPHKEIIVLIIDDGERHFGSWTFFYISFYSYSFYTFLFEYNCLVLFSGAVYGGNQALVLETRQNRQQLERVLTVSMFTVKLTEMKTEWLLNK